MMYDTARELRETLQATPTTLAALLATCTQEQARTARGGDEGWSVVEVICHLRDAEERALERTIAMRDEVEPFLPGYDQEAWARERNYADADLHDAFAAFERFRAAHVAVLAALPETEWARDGLHEEQGRITISSHILHMVAHDAAHAAQIARQLQPGLSQPG